MWKLSVDGTQRISYTILSNDLQSFEKKKKIVYVIEN